MWIKNENLSMNPQLTTSSLYKFQLINLQQPTKRRIQFVELHSIGAWTLKVYSINYRHQNPDMHLLEKAKDLAGKSLPRVSENIYGFGFIVLHEGQMENSISINWWQDNNLLRHHDFVTTLNDDFSFSDLPDNVHSTCIWDLQLISFEKDAWVKQVLQKSIPDIEAYLAERMNCSI